MDDQINFRALLLQLQDGLSDSDRKRLHFILGDIIPATLRDDHTMGGTLKLLENLLTHAKISEQDVTFLIQVFSKIHCRTIVEKLKQHQGNQQRHQNLQSVLSRTKSMIDQVIEDQEDGGRPSLNVDTETESKLQTTLLPSTTLPSTIVTLSSDEPHVSFEKTQSHLNRRNRILKRRTSKCAVTMVLLNILFLTISIILFIFCVTWRTRPVQPLDNIYHIKNGPSYGGNGGSSFDDAKDYGLTYGDRCIGVEIHWEASYLHSIRFIYNTSSVQYPRHNRSRGTDDGFRDIFELSSDEEINKIAVSTVILPTIKPNPTVHVLAGIQFFTTKGQSSKQYGGNEESASIEFHPGYTLFYVKGKAGLFIDQLQFVWSKTCSRRNSKECMPE